MTNARSHTNDGTPNTTPTWWLAFATALFLTLAAISPNVAAQAAESSITAGEVTSEIALGGELGDDLDDGFGDDLGSFLDDIELDDLVEVEPPPGPLKSIIAPILLVVVGFGIGGIFMWIVPFHPGRNTIMLYHLPTGIRRGLAMATTMYGIAFLFGALEIHYQLNMHGSAEAYFANMSNGKLIAFTHAHLFGFTTSFLIVGVPFSLQFPHLRWYQAMMPIGLTAAIIDVISWWGIKYVSVNFEWVSMFCGILFSLSYLFMLVALLRVLLFPWVTLPSDKNRRKKFMADNDIWH